MYETFLKPLLADIKHFLLETFFPIVCVWCEQEGQYLCDDCQKRLVKVDRQLCILCHKPSPLGLTHSGCKSLHAPDGLVSFYDYHDKKVAKLIIDGKYNFIFGIFEFLGKLIAEHITNREYVQIFKNFTLTPIPLSPFRQRWRGFNQAEILCQMLSTTLDLPYLQTLKRKRSTKTQKDLKKHARQYNVRNAFAVLDKASVTGKNILLIDDVITTGSTLLEAVKTLKRNGAHRVWCLTLARD